MWGVGRKVVGSLHKMHENLDSAKSKKAVQKRGVGGGDEETN